MTLETELELKIIVEYTYHRACRGARDSLGGVRGAGPPLEPDEDEHVDIDSVKCQGHEIEIDDKERERLEELCLEQATDRDFD